MALQAKLDDRFWKLENWKLFKWMDPKSLVLWSQSKTKCQSSEELNSHKYVIDTFREMCKTADFTLHKMLKECSAWEQLKVKQHFIHISPWFCFFVWVPPFLVMFLLENCVGTLLEGENVFDYVADQCNTSIQVQSHSLPCLNWMRFLFIQLLLKKLIFNEDSA